MTAAVCTLASLIAIILLWIPSIGFPQCGVTNFFLGETLLFGLGFALVSMLQQVGQGALPPSILWVNSVFLAYGAMSNNPDAECNPLAGDTQWGTILISLIFAAVALVWMAFRAASTGYDILCPGSRSTLVPEKNEEADQRRREEQDEALEGSSAGAAAPGVGGSGAVAVQEWGAGADGPAATPSGASHGGAGEHSADNPAASGSGTSMYGATPVPAGGVRSNSGYHVAIGQSPEEIAQQEKEALESIEGAPWVFHLIMAAGGLYLAMVMTNWGYATEDGEQSVAVEASDIAMWVRVACQFAIHAIYAWILAAPLCFPDRDFGARASEY